MHSYGRQQQFISLSSSLLVKKLCSFTSISQVFWSFISWFLTIPASVSKWIVSHPLRCGELETTRGVLGGAVVPSRANPLKSLHINTLFTCMRAGASLCVLEVFSSKCWLLTRGQRRHWCEALLFIRTNVQPGFIFFNAFENKLLWKWANSSSLEVPDQFLA